MNATLAAEAAVVELPAYGEIVDVLLDSANGDEANPLAVRDALLELAQLTAEAEQVDALKKQIVERYATKMKTLAGRAQAIRDSLEVYAIRYGKTSFPDVGGIHLTTQNKGGKLFLADKVVFEDHLRATFPQIVESCTETVEVFDATSAFEMFVDEFGVKATPGGAIVDVQTGEDKTAPFQNVGVGVIAESKSLAVRKS